MEQNEIFAPFFAQMFLTFLVWVYMYSRRIPFIVNSRLTPDQMTPAELARLSPPAVSNPSDNLKNLFEIPTLFYALVLYLFVTQHVDALYLAAAWMFVAFRVLHSLMHCTANIIIVRFWLYAISTLALWFMLGRAALAGLGAFF
jgi:hypothetical protein